MVNFTIYIDPGVRTRVWINDVLMATGGTVSGTDNSTLAGVHPYAFRLFENSTLYTGNMSDFAFVLDDRKEAETHVHTEDYTTGKRVSFTDDTLSYIYQCYCGVYVEETISSVIRNGIDNFYNGYGKVEELELPTDGRFWVSTDINIKKDGLSGSLIKIGDNDLLSVSQLKNVTAPTSVNASVMIVHSGFAKVYIDGVFSHSVDLTGEIDSITFGEENTYDSYVTFKNNKIVTLAQNAQNSPKITFNDNPEGAICYHRNNTNTSYRSGGEYIFTAPADGYTFGDSATVKGMKNVKARYICSECGEAVYAVQGEAVEVNFTPASGYDNGGSGKLSVDADGSFTVNSSKAILTDLTDMGRGNNYWISFDITADSINYTALMASKKSSGGSFLALMADNGKLTTAGGAYSHLQLLRAYAVLRPNAEAENGVYGAEDYYDDRIGIYHTSTSSMSAQLEEKYEFIIMEGCSYRIDICFEHATVNSSYYSIYVNGKRVYSGGKIESEMYAPARMENATALEALMKRPAALRFLDGSYGTYKVSNFAFVKMGGGYDDYSENTSVFEMSAAKPAKAETLASINGVELLSATAEGQLTVGGTALYTKADGVFTPAVLTDTASNLAIVYYNQTARYYINEDLAFLGETDNVTAAIAVGDTDISATNLKVGSTVTISDIYGVADDGDADYITFQEGVDTTFNSEIRVLSGVDMLYYNRVGYRVVTDNNGTVTSSTEKSLSVYSSVLENVGSTTNTVDAARYGHRYYSILKLTDLANNDAANEYYLYVTPFTMIDDEIVYSAKTAKITVTKGSENSYVHTTVSTDTVPAVTETVE